MFPDLAGHLTQSGQLSPDSTEEQNLAGLNDLTEEEIATIGQLNKQYDY